MHQQCYFQNILNNANNKYVEKSDRQIKKKMLKKNIFITPNHDGYL